MEHTCEYCGKSFSKKQNLKNHVETAKYCAKLRGDIPTKKYICKFCDKSFTQKGHMDAHLKGCSEYKVYTASEKEKKLKELEVGQLNNETEKYAKRLKLVRLDLAKEKARVKLLVEAEIKRLAVQEKLQIELEQLQAENEEQKEKIIALEKNLEYGKGILTGYEKVKPPNVITTTNNTIVNQKLAALKVDNIKPLTQATIQEHTPNYTFELFLKGEAGIVEYITGMTQLQMEDGTIEQNYACTDKSRNTFHRLMESKVWTHDGGARYINQVIDSLAVIAEEHWQTLFHRMRTSTDPLDADYYQRKVSELMRFRCSFSDPHSTYREQSFKKIKAQMKNISSV